MADAFPSLKAGQMLRVLGRLGYAPDSGKGKGGSHVWLRAEGRPSLRWAFHDRATLAPGKVRSILVKDVGLSIEEALEVVGRG